MLQKSKDSNINEEDLTVCKITEAYLANNIDILHQLLMLCR